MLMQSKTLNPSLTAKSVEPFQGRTKGSPSDFAGGMAKIAITRKEGDLWLQEVQTVLLLSLHLQPLYKV